MQADGGAREATFEELYGSLAKDVFRQIASDALAEGKNPDEQARQYAEIGKPDFALAYLLAGHLPDAAKRDVLAHAYRQRASITEERAREFDRAYHRPFPLLLTDAANDRTAARRVLASQPLHPRAGRQLPTM